MPKTYNNLFPAIYDFENLFNAYLKARQNKRYREDVLKFSYNLESNLIEIQNELIYKSYKPGFARQFYIYDPKTRLVTVAPFRDRVVHHALCNIIEPIYEAKLYSHSYACRQGKGTHACVQFVSDSLQKAIRNYGKVYCFKGDVHKYFQSINHDILKRILRKTIRCRDTLWLIDKIIDGPDNNEYIPLNQVGLPVGNLTSQMFANIYLNELDEFMKQTQHAEIYIRYMDDFLVLHPNKAYLKDLWHDTDFFLSDALALKLNSKTAVFPASQGIDYLGYRIWSTNKILRKTNCKRIHRVLRKFERRLKEGTIDLDKIRSTLASWLGHAKHANVPILRQKVLSKATNTFGLKGLK